MSASIFCSYFRLSNVKSQNCTRKSLTLPRHRIEIWIDVRTPSEIGFCPTCDWKCRARTAFAQYILDTRRAIPLEGLQSASSSVHVYESIPVVEDNLSAIANQGYVSQYTTLRPEFRTYAPVSVVLCCSLSFFRRAQSLHNFYSPRSFLHALVDQNYESISMGWIGSVILDYVLAGITIQKRFMNMK